MADHPPGRGYLSTAPTFSPDEGEDRDHTAADRGDAVQRLDAALAKYERLKEAWRGAIGTRHEIGTHARFLVAREELAVLQELTTANEGDRGGGSQECANAHQRLDAALVEQDRVGELFNAAIGTSTELGAYVRLRAADQKVRERDAWAKWVDDEGYRGLNAGPFELLAERSGSTDAAG